MVWKICKTYSCFIDSKIPVILWFFLPNKVIKRSRKLISFPTLCFLFCCNSLLYKLHLCFLWNIVINLSRSPLPHFPLLTFFKQNWFTNESAKQQYEFDIDDCLNIIQANDACQEMKLRKPSPNKHVLGFGYSKLDINKVKLNQ